MRLEPPADVAMQCAPFHRPGPTPTPKPDQDQPKAPHRGRGPPSRLSPPNLGDRDLHRRGELSSFEVPPGVWPGARPTLGRSRRTQRPRLAQLWPRLARARWMGGLRQTLASAFNPSSTDFGVRLRLARVRPSSGHPKGRTTLTLERVLSDATFAKDLSTSCATTRFYKTLQAELGHGTPPQMYMRPGNFPAEAWQRLDAMGGNASHAPAMSTPATVARRTEIHPNAPL